MQVQKCGADAAGLIFLLFKLYAMEIGLKENAAMFYELFIRRAFKCGRHPHGANADRFRLLIDYEEYYKSEKPNSFESQLSEMIDFLDKAIIQFLNKFDLSPSEREGLVLLQSQLKDVNSSEKLKDVVHSGIEITQRFKEF